MTDIPPKNDNRRVGLDVIETQATTINREAFDIFLKLIKAPLKDPERVRLANESLIADLLGDNPVPVPRTSTVDSKVIDLLRSFIHLSEVPHRFTDTETMVKYYPWRGKISRGQHLEHCYFLIAHEAYILEERLKRFLKCICACADGRAFPIDLKLMPKGIMRDHKSLFGPIVAARGTHVHMETSVPRDIKRVGELELHMKLSNFGPFAYLHRDAVTKARKHWMSYAGQARGGAEQLIALALLKTRIVWETVIQEEADKLAANGP